jgi:hypothetical protein
MEGAAMTNVVSFPRPEPETPHYLLLTTLIDPNSPLEEGDLVAVQWTTKGVPGDVLFWRWWGPTGRDGNGRFVKKGSPDEYYELDGMKYCVKDFSRDRFGNWFKILGKVMLARDLGERLPLPPKAS